MELSVKKSNCYNSVAEVWPIGISRMFVYRGKKLRAATLLEDLSRFGLHRLWKNKYFVARNEDNETFHVFDYYRRNLKAYKLAGPLQQRRSKNSQRLVPHYFYCWIMFSRFNRKTIPTYWKGSEDSSPWKYKSLMGGSTMTEPQTFMSVKKEWDLCTYKSGKCSKICNPDTVLKLAVNIWIRFPYCMSVNVWPSRFKSIAFQIMFHFKWFSLFQKTS